MRTLLMVVGFLVAAKILVALFGPQVMAAVSFMVVLVWLCKGQAALEEEKRRIGK